MNVMAYTECVTYYLPPPTPHDVRDGWGQGDYLPLNCPYTAHSSSGASLLTGSWKSGAGRRGDKCPTLLSSHFAMLLAFTVRQRRMIGLLMN
jgi:hypothetical protein